MINKIKNYFLPVTVGTVLNCTSPFLCCFTAVMLLCCAVMLCYAERCCIVLIVNLMLHGMRGDVTMQRVSGLRELYVE